MKYIAAALFLSLQLAGSAFAAHEISHTEAENVVEQRQRNLQKKTPLNAEEKVFLKRLLSNKTLRYADKVSDDQLERRNSADNDPLSMAMRESAISKFGEMKASNQEEPRSLQNQVMITNPVNANVARVDIPEKLSMILEAFQDSRNLVEPVKLSAELSSLTAGTEYLFANEPVFNVLFDVPPGLDRAVYMVNERDRISTVSGSCTRTDPKTSYVGRAYCQLEYQFLDSQGNVEASIMSEGPITKGDVNTLSITGGSGVFRRTVGTVVLEAGRLRSGNPPIFIPDERLDLPSSYLVKMFVFMDSVDLEYL